VITALSKTIAKKRWRDRLENLTSEDEA